MDLNKICLACMEGHIGPDNRCNVCGHEAITAPQNALALHLETILHGRYLLGSTLGQGGFGITYVGLDLNQMKRVAIKEFFPASIVSRAHNSNSVVVRKNEEYYERCMQSFLNEAQMIYSFDQHPNIVNIYHIFKDNNTVYYVMEYLEGETLEQKLHRLDHRMTWDELSPIVADIIKALNTIHKHSYIHRDVSPDNIFLHKNGMTKLIDFGAARYVKSHTDLTVVLKKGFAPPEQYQGDGNQGPWTDIYALAATMYYCLTGQMIPDAPKRATGAPLKPPSELGIQLPTQVEAALIKALNMNSLQRFSNVTDFSGALFSRQYIPQQRDQWQLRIVAGCYHGNTVRCDQSVSVGRDPSKCTLVYPDKSPGISRTHMTFLFGHGAGYPGLRCDTQDGVIFVNGMPFQGKNRLRKISDGDTVVFGNGNKIVVEKI